MTLLLPCMVCNEFAHITHKGVSLHPTHTTRWDTGLARDRGTASKLHIRGRRAEKIDIGHGGTNMIRQCQRRMVVVCWNMRTDTARAGCAYSFESVRAPTLESRYHNIKYSFIRNRHSHRRGRADEGARLPIVVPRLVRPSEERARPDGRVIGDRVWWDAVCPHSRQERRRLNPLSRFFARLPERTQNSSDVTGRAGHTGVC